ncbi:MAG TPA: hypothetical protein VFZ65_17250 [Planctomycetota bacterium]|nr:hypothetical protein [Planctomycetota bacterium]
MTTETEHSRLDPRSSAGVRATVRASLANGMFRLQIDDGREVVAHAAKDLRMAFTRLLPGDAVLVDLSPFDPNKARICRLLKSPTEPAGQAGASRSTNVEAPVPPSLPSSACTDVRALQPKRELS